MHRKGGGERSQNYNMQRRSKRLACQRFFPDEEDTLSAEAQEVVVVEAGAASLDETVLGMGAGTE